MGMSLRDTFTCAAEFCLTTHTDPRCIICCAMGTALVRGVILGEVNHAARIYPIIYEAIEWFDEWRVADGRHIGEVDRAELLEAAADITVDALRARLQVETEGVGHVYQAFAAGLYTLRSILTRIHGRHLPNFQNDPLLFCPMITIFWGNSSPNGCFAGALARALLGFSTIKKFSSLCISRENHRWLEKVMRKLDRILYTSTDRPLASDPAFTSRWGYHTRRLDASMRERRDDYFEHELRKQRRSCERKQNARSGNLKDVLKFLFRI